MITKGDFIEVDYTGTVGGQVFDTTIKQVGEKAGLKGGHFHPARICVGESHVLPGLDRDFEGKQFGREYSITLPPEQAFGKRDLKRIKIVPASTFKEHKVQPHPGLQIDMDGEVGIVTSVSGGRIIVNFNHPLAGKEVVYKYTVHSKISEPKEQIMAYLHSFLRIPEDKMSVEIKEHEANVTVPFEFPPQFAAAVSKKLKELVKLDVQFVKK